MDRDVERLLSLQDIDMRIDRLREEMEEIPRERRIHEREIEGFRRAFEEERSLVSELRSSREKNAADRDATEERLAEFRKQLLEMKTNPAYRAMLEQIKYAERKMDSLDGSILELMYEEEEAEKRLAEAEKTLERNVSRAERRKEMLDGQMEVLEERMEELLGERSALLSGIDARLLARYERLRDAGKGMVVVGLSQGACGGCHTNVPPQTAVEISQGRTFACPICGRFVVWTDESTFQGSTD